LAEKLASAARLLTNPLGRSLSQPPHRRFRTAAPNPHRPSTQASGNSARCCWTGLRKVGEVCGADARICRNRLFRPRCPFRLFQPPSTADPSSGPVWATTMTSIFTRSPEAAGAAVLARRPKGDGTEPAHGRVGEGKRGSERAGNDRKGQEMAQILESAVLSHCRTELLLSPYVQKPLNPGRCDCECRHVVVLILQKYQVRTGPYLTPGPGHGDSAN
jgi:hypothetical protein